MSRPRRVPGCDEPGCQGNHHGQGLCRVHYLRRYRNGSTEFSGRLVRNVVPALEARRDSGAAMTENYQWLREDVRMSREAAAQRLGVSLRTTYRYDRRLRSGAASRQEAA